MFSIFLIKMIYLLLKWYNLKIIFYYYYLLIFFHLLSFQRFLFHPPRVLPPYGGLGLLPGAWGALLRGMPTEPMVFLAMSDACGLRPCDRTHLKNGLVSYLSGCSTMGVGCQSRRFNCLFWRETRQRILGHEISPYPEVVRGGEWELTTRPERQLVAGDQERQLVTGEQRGRQQKLAWKNGGAVNTRHRAERRGDKIGSSEEESQDVWSQ